MAQKMHSSANSSSARVLASLPAFSTALIAISGKIQFRRLQNRRKAQESRLFERARGVILNSWSGWRKKVAKRELLIKRRHMEINTKAAAAGATRELPI
jgi:hypothetical protein